jgi:hypothetical protein
MVYLNEIVTGERLQALADVSIIPYGEGIGESNCDFVIKQQQNNNYNVFYYTETVTELPEYVHNARVIFVNTWTLNKFFNLIFPLLKNNHIFISHNSDKCFTDEYIHFLNNKKVVKWFSQNINTEHDKLFAIPIGIANQQYNHGNLSLLEELSNKDIQKINFIFKNFDINTNIQVRSYINNITTLNNIPMLNHMSQPDYFVNLASSTFCISPPGNGPDCHRVWECLYLKTIPIIKNDLCFKQFNKLPILFIESWEQVTVPFLKEKILLFLNTPFKTDELKMSFWREKIYAN